MVRRLGGWKSKVVPSSPDEGHRDLHASDIPGTRVDSLDKDDVHAGLKDLSVCISTVPENGG
jgi:hypothetical protein